MPPLACNWALFLDIDGTLLEIAETPGLARAYQEDCRLVERLHHAARGAVALVSGRPLQVIDELFHPLRLPAAGQHGIERRDARGRVHRPAYPFEALQSAAAVLRQFAAEHEGLVFENKGYSMALHYRRAPQLADAAQGAVRQAARALGDWVEVQTGKMVSELKPAGRNKGLAIEEFMREAPFKGRVPVFLGDDQTDENGFRVVNRAGGLTFKVGEGSTAAKERLKDPTAVRHWLTEWLRRCA